MKNSKKFIKNLKKFIKFFVCLYMFAIFFASILAIIFSVEEFGAEGSKNTFGIIICAIIIYAILAMISFFILDALLFKKSLFKKIFKIIFKKCKILFTNTEKIAQESGLYAPTFEFANALDYKEELLKIRQKQKDIIKQGKAVIATTNHIVNGSAREGQKVVRDMQKLLLRAFNTECDDLVNKIKYTNYDTSLDRMYKSAEAISRLGAAMDISISNEYLFAKHDELYLAFEYQRKKQEEREELREARELQREEQKAQKELEKRLQELEKEQTHYQTAYQKLKLQLLTNPNNADLIQKQNQIEMTLQDIEKALQDIDYRQANMRAGYVYVISNIGSFGKDIYKIGMTRRLEPQDRIDELSSASVPFNFDVHAMIFSADAPALEAALHRAFEDKKVNMVNHRREFFHVTLDEIKSVVKKNFDKTVEFIDYPEAEQFRISEKIWKEKQKIL